MQIEIPAALKNLRTVTSEDRRVSVLADMSCKETRFAWISERALQTLQRNPAPDQACGPQVETCPVHVV